MGWPASNLHWNYFIALERDLDAVSRYIEFAPANFDVYSIELAHLLFAASSEVDVVAKLICGRVAPSERRGNIDDYRAIMNAHFPELSGKPVLVARYGLTLTPWAQWKSGDNPGWWRSYNRVKHERDVYFHQATLGNALNALGALLILTITYYSGILPQTDERHPIKGITGQLRPESSLLRLTDDHYYDNVVT